MLGTGGRVGAGVAGELHIEGLRIPDVLAVDLIFEHSVLEDGDVRMLLQVFDILFQAEIHQVHDGGAAFATGKVIFVDGDDVDVKTVFVCEVE